MGLKIYQLAAGFASLAHAGQTRKYTGEPYFNHCKEVADLVAEAGGDDAMVAAAYLHDVVEDTNIPLERICREFGDDIAGLVSDLTDVSKPSDGNRKTRKAIDLEHTAKASPRAKTIKLADIISNSASILERDPDFAKVYLEEKRAQLEVLKDGDPKLWLRALTSLVPK